MPAWWENVAAADARVNPKNPKSKPQRKTKNTREVQPTMVFERYQRKYWQQKCKECNHKWLWPCDKKTPLEFCPKCQQPWTNLEHDKPGKMTPEERKANSCPKAANMLPHRFDLGKCAYCKVAWGDLQAKLYPPVVTDADLLGRTASEINFYAHQEERNAAMQKAILDSAPNQAMTVVADANAAGPDGWPVLKRKGKVGKVVEVDRFSLDCP